MPTKRKFRLRQRKAGSFASPALISMLSDPDDPIEGRVRLQIQMRDELFAGLSDENDADVRKGANILRKLWPKHAVAATQFCIQRCGVGHRPSLWWEKRNDRPFVKPRDNRDASDDPRFRRERLAADIEFLESHGLLTKSEKTALAESRKEKKYGPSSDS